MLRHLTICRISGCLCIAHPSCVWVVLLSRTLWGVGFGNCATCRSDGDPTWTCPAAVSTYVDLGGPDSQFLELDGGTGKRHRVFTPLQDYRIPRAIGQRIPSDQFAPPTNLGAGSLDNEDSAKLNFPPHVFEGNRLCRSSQGVCYLIARFQHTVGDTHRAAFAYRRNLARGDFTLIKRTAQKNGRKRLSGCQQHDHRDPTVRITH